ncbi:hypothetical protein AB0E27_20230 [Streptomyces sparsogenes]|uniref:hypothetical protein n=1 Tax=Streptomyces sparsogenes TaxID=67365 RepID=UPI0033FF429D
MPIPPAALAVMRAGAEEYRLTTPATEATPAGVAERIAEYLASEGYAVRPAVPLYARAWAAIATRFRRRPRARPTATRANEEPPR